VTKPVSISLILLTFNLAAFAADPPPAAPAKPLTARQIVDRIKQNVKTPWLTTTVDTFKAGDPDTPVTGIVTTHLATLDVLQRAVTANKNFIISHEPVFYNHLDRTEPLGDDPVLAAKRAYIAKHGLIVFRFHDHWHRRMPDGIDQGVSAKLGWDAYRRADEDSYFDIPAASLKDLAATFKEKLGASVVRVVGKPDAKFTKVGMLPGAAGSARHIKMLQRDDVEVLAIGESPEWETVEYVRDAITQGKPKALILLGHANSEEPGMANCAIWLKTFIPEVPVDFLPAGDPFWSPTPETKK